MFGVNALKIEKLKNKHIINVNLEIPKKFYEELRDGKVVRVGGSLKHPTRMYSGSILKTSNHQASVNSPKRSMWSLLHRCFGTGVS